MDRQKLTQLFERYLRNECNESELNILLDHFGEQTNEADLKHLILDAIRVEVPESILNSQSVQEDLKKIDVRFLAHALRDATIRTSRFRRYAVAASIALALGIGSYVYRATYPSTTNGQYQVADAVPATDKAILTLPDGRKIFLDSTESGTVFEDNGINITRTADGQLVYTATPTGKTDTSHNELRVPRGGQYRVVLPDGSNVWLNAASTLRYPTQFDAKSRVVELDGEAFFSVKRELGPKGRQQQGVPFIVRTKNQEIVVLGTEFNVMAYADEYATKTTLAEGSVRVNHSGVFETSHTGRDVRTAVLKPGQQAASRNGIMAVHRVDVEQEISWKNGHFAFNDMPLVDILNQLARWYDVGFDPSGIPQTNYTVFLSRQVKLSNVLSLLEKTGNFRLSLDNTNKIVVTAKNEVPM